jgi:hypothetical protein
VAGVPEEKFSKLQTNGRSVISVEKIAYCTFNPILSASKVADRHTLRISKAKTTTPNEYN